MVGLANCFLARKIILNIIKLVIIKKNNAIIHNIIVPLANI
jgi:hypothetical protein